MVDEENCSWFFPWLKRREIEQQCPNSYGNSTPRTGSIVIWLSLLSGTSPNLSSSHFKNSQVRLPHIYTLKVICKGVATELRPPHQEGSQRGCFHDDRFIQSCLQSLLWSYRTTAIHVQGTSLGPEYRLICGTGANCPLRIKTITLASSAVSELLSSTATDKQTPEGFGSETGACALG